MKIKKKFFGGASVRASLVLSALCLLTSALCLRADVQTLTLDNHYVSTNTFGDGVIDLRGAATVGLQVDFTGQAKGRTTAILGLTNTTAFGHVVRLELAGTAHSYFFTNNPTTNFQALSASAPIIQIGITNVATNGQTLTIILNARTNTYIWTNAAAASPFVLTNNTAAKCATNLFEVLKADLEGGLPATRSVAVSYLSATLLNLQAQVNDRFSVTNAGDWGTNFNTSVYTVTNTVATNLYHVLTGTAAESTTNLYTRLAADYGDSLLVNYSGAQLLTLQTPYGEAFTLTNTVALGTNSITTNSITGTVTLRCSNTLDRVTWYYDPAHNLAMSYSGTAAVGLITNFTVGPYPFWTYSVENPAANYANPGRFKFQYNPR